MDLSSNNTARWLEEELNRPDSADESSADEDCSQEEEHMTQSPHESDSEIEAVDVNVPSSSDEDDQPLSSFASYTSRNGTKWSKRPPIVTRTRAHNIILQPPGPKGGAKEEKAPLSCFELFLDCEIVDILVSSTNIYIECNKHKYTRERDAKLTDSVEMKAFIGMLIVIGVNRSGRQNLSDFWNNSYGTGIKLVYTTMSINRFRFLLRCLRFDDIRDRSTRQQFDKLAPIRSIASITLRNCQKYYTPSDQLTIDEQLVAFKGRCGFIMYLPNKPCKFGIKIVMVVDTKYPYMYNFEIYAGEQPEGPYRASNKVHDLTMRILNPVCDVGRNITMDNWFTSYPLSQELLKKKVTVVGTLKSNKPEIPTEFIAVRNKELYSSEFGFQKDCTLVSYVTKKNKCVLLLSTMHNDDKIDADSGDKRKPEIITFYNHTKFGVDVLDRMCRQYDVTRNTRRWPLCLFYNFLNIYGINSLIIHQMNNIDLKTKRRHFLHDVGFELVKPLIQRRVSQDNIPRSLKMRGRALHGLEDQPTRTVGPVRGGVGRCAFCPRTRDRSTRKICDSCNRRVCNDHHSIICADCRI